MIQHTQALLEAASFDPRALKIVQNLQDAGFEAYLVGGCLRDIVLGQQPKDFDIATNAHPEQVKALFRNCRLIGRRFRLAHVFFGRDIFEVATFRRDAEAHENVNGDNCYGTLEDDIQRRDFTVNALYYDPFRKRLIDEVGALDDLKNGVLRMIGEPHIRYEEDPVRMLRALRFAAKLGLQLDGEVLAAMPAHRKRLLDVSSARLLDECQKLFLGGYGLASFRQLRQHQMFHMLFPDVERVFSHPNQAFAQYSLRLIEATLAGTDKRLQEGKSAVLAFLFAAFFWPLFQLQYHGSLNRRSEPWHDLLHEAADLVLVAANERVALPMRLRGFIREVWALQARLEYANGNKRKMRHVLSHLRFRAAYDFLLLRHQAGEEALQELCHRWTQLQEDHFLQDERRAAEHRQWQHQEEDERWFDDD